MTKKESCGDCRYFELKDEHEVSGICCIRAPQAAVLLTGRPLDCWPEVHSDKWCGEFEPIALSRAPQPDVMDFVDPGPMGEGIFKDKDNLVWYAEPLVRAALTAALAARGKA